MATSSETGRWISHDGAEQRVDYDENNHDKYPNDLEIEELYQDTLSETEVGHGRIRYRIEASQDGKRYEITLTETGNPGFGSIIRATPLEDSSVVYHGRSNVDPGMLLNEEEPLNGERLENSY